MVDPRVPRCEELDINESTAADYPSSGGPDWAVTIKRHHPGMWPSANVRNRRMGKSTPLLFVASIQLIADVHF